MTVPEIEAQCAKLGWEMASQEFEIVGPQQHHHLRSVQDPQ